jgi:hypothetical protein
MVVGILESESDRFISDVVSLLSGISVEFIHSGMGKIPIEHRFQVVVDRLSFCTPFLKEIVKALSLNGTYVINNPFTASLTNKLIEIHIGRSLGMSFPKTIVLPDQSAIADNDGVVSQPFLEQVAEEIGLPMILKPFDGYAWEDVYQVNSLDELRKLYLELSSRHVFIAQQLIRFKQYFRAFCFDKRDVLFIRWIPRPMAMGQYIYNEQDFLGNARHRLTDLTIQLNQALDLDVNTMEWCVDEEGRWWVIDAYNEVPDIIPEAIPAEYYTWIVDRFAACIKDKLNTSKRNRVTFDLSVKSA